MICLRERVNHYKSVKLHDTLTFNDRTYVRLAISDVHVVDNGFAEFVSVCQEVNEDFSDLDLKLKSKIFKVQTIKNASYERVPLGQFGVINIDDGRKLFIRITGVSDFSWNFTDFNYYYIGELVEPLTKIEIKQIMKDQRVSELKTHYQATEDKKVIKLVLGENK